MIFKHKIIIQEKYIEMPLIRNRIYIPVSPPPTTILFFLRCTEFYKVFFVFFFFAPLLFKTHTETYTLWMSGPDVISGVHWPSSSRRLFFIIIFILHLYIPPPIFNAVLASSSSKVVRTAQYKSFGDPHCRC